jgi:hypothetical protein
MAVDISFDSVEEIFEVVKDAAESSQIDKIDGSSQSSSLSRDSIDRMVSQLKGKTFIVNTPVEFAKAIGQVAAVRDK